jgi:hypothetical protein
MTLYGLCQNTIIGRQKQLPFDAFFLETGMILAHPAVRVLTDEGHGQSEHEPKKPDTNPSCGVQQGR